MNKIVKQIGIFKQQFMLKRLYYTYPDFEYDTRLSLITPEQF